MDTQVVQDYNKDLVLGLILVVFYSLIIAIFVLDHKMKLRAKRGGNSKMYRKKKGVIAYVTGRHLSGLPLASGMQCVLYYYPDRIEIDANGNVFAIAIMKVNDVFSDRKTEENYHYIPRPHYKVETITDTSTTMGLVISYINNRNILEHLRFDVIYDEKRAAKFVRTFNKYNATKQKINTNL